MPGIGGKFGPDYAAYNKKALAPSERRESVSFLVAEKGLSVVKACAAVDLSRSAWYRKPQDKLERDKEVIDALQSLVEKRPRWGFYLCYKRLRMDGHKWNHKRACIQGLQGAWLEHSQKD